MPFPGILFEPDEKEEKKIPPFSLCYFIRRRRAFLDCVSHCSNDFVTFGWRQSLSNNSPKFSKVPPFCLKLMILLWFFLFSFRKNVWSRVWLNNKEKLSSEFCCLPSKETCSSLSLSRLFDINAVKRGRGRENMNNIQYSKAKVVLKWLAVWRSQVVAGAWRRWWCV